METQGGATATPRNQTVMHRSSRRSLGVELTSHFGCTPGQLTAIRTQTRREISKPRNLSELVDPEHLAALVKEEWRISYLTPMYQFKHTQLQSYSKRLAAFIVAEKQQGIGVEVGPEMGLKVVFSAVHGLAETEDDAEAVFIQIHSKSAAAEGEATKVVWSGWLCCVSGEVEYLRSLSTDFTCLPLFGASGAVSLTTTVMSWFERTFDCYFGPLGIDSTGLKWLAALWTGCHPDINIRYLKLSWTIPAQPPLDVSYTVHPQDAWELWNSIREVDGLGDTVGIEEVTYFMKGLEMHFFRHFRIYLSAGTLTKVTTALGSAHRDGKIRITSGDMMTSVLALLTECALLKMPI
ncbi:hypothetical protein AAFF_G00108010 [Aldrovandia affinis]|uniref:Centromere protein L n=1 Tax=Aldrovandia affinis TaxID=143900 RepID=A0AAD7RU62_9TELE|nr:hypothetical protein AAFF_G00108010 [Aldrovandia affinis]